MDNRIVDFQCTIAVNQSNQNIRILNKKLRHFNNKLINLMDWMNIVTKLIPYTIYVLDNALRIPLHVTLHNNIVHLKSFNHTHIATYIPNFHCSHCYCVMSLNNIEMYHVWERDSEIMWHVTKCIYKVHPYVWCSFIIAK